MCSTLLVGEEVNPVLVPLGGPGKFLLNPCGQHNVIWASWNDQSSEFGNQNWQSWVCLVYSLVWGKFYHQRIWVSLKVYYDLCLPYVLHCFSILPLSLRSVSLVFWKIFWLGHFFFSQMETLLKCVEGQWKRFLTVMEDSRVYDGPYFFRETIWWSWTISPVNVLSCTGELYLYGGRFYCSGRESSWEQSLSQNFRSCISYVGLMPQGTLSIKTTG